MPLLPSPKLSVDDFRGLLKAKVGRDIVTTVLKCAAADRVCAETQPDARVLTVIAERRGSVEDVAAHLGVAKDSVYRWVEREGLPAYKMGRLWKFKLSEVDEWVHVGGTAEERTRK